MITSSSGAPAGQMASTGIDCVVAISVSNSLIIGEWSVQSASSGTTSLLSTSLLHSLGVDGQLRFHLQLGHQSAVKSTITVLPSARAWPGPRARTACQGIFEVVEQDREGEHADQPRPSTAPPIQAGLRLAGGWP